jgi:hypothetical protein
MTLTWTGIFYKVLHYEGYGKDYIKRYKLSPDGWAQLVKQLAFHKMFSRPGVTYESAQTRKYQLGRTEVIRSASNESKEWVEAMSSPAPKVTLFSCHKVKYHLTFEIVYGIGPSLSNGSLPQGCISARSIFSVGSRWAGCGSTLVWAEEVSKGRRAATGDLQGRVLFQEQPLGTIDQSVE